MVKVTDDFKARLANAQQRGLEAIHEAAFKGRIPESFPQPHEAATRMEKAARNVVLCNRNPYSKGVAGNPDAQKQVRENGRLNTKIGKAKNETDAIKGYEGFHTTSYELSSGTENAYAATLAEKFLTAVIGELEKSRTRQPRKVNIAPAPEQAPEAP